MNDKDDVDDQKTWQQGNSDVGDVSVHSSQEEDSESEDGDEKSVLDRPNDFVFLSCVSKYNSNAKCLKNQKVAQRLHWLLHKPWFWSFECFANLQPWVIENQWHYEWSQKNVSVLELMLEAHDVGDNNLFHKSLETEVDEHKQDDQSQ